MKIARFFAAVFAVLGIVLMLLSVVVCFASMDAKVKVLETPEGAVACAEQLVQAVDAGDFAAIEKLLYGQPSLGAAGEPEDPVAAMLWQRYREEMTCVAGSKLHLSGTDFVCNVTVTTLDVASITGSVQARAKVLLEQAVAAATDMEQLYDGSGNFHPELLDQVVEQALSQAMEADARYITTETGFKVIRWDGQWWAVPDQAMLNAIAGAAA